MTDKLKPCPFCGSDHIKMYRGMTSMTDGWWYVLCEDCHTEGPADLGESGAIERWNTRPLEDALLEALKRTMAMEQGQRFVTYEDIDFANAALAKARGEA